MIRHRCHRSQGRRGALARAAVLALVLLSAAAGCSHDTTSVDPGQRLCNGDGGLGLRVDGRAQELQFCVDDPGVSVVLTSGSRYDIAAQMRSGGDVFQVRMVFSLRPDAPVTLHVVSSVDSTASDPGAAWIYYEEIPADGKTIESGSASGGEVRLSFSDKGTLAGTIEGVTLTMRDLASGDPAGTRKITEGFFSLSVKNPARQVARPPGINA